MGEVRWGQIERWGGGRSRGGVGGTVVEWEVGCWEVGRREGGGGRWGTVVLWYLLVQCSDHTLLSPHPLTSSPGDGESSEGAGPHSSV